MDPQNTLPREKQSFYQWRNYVPVPSETELLRLLEWDDAYRNAASLLTRTIHQLRTLLPRAQIAHVGSTSIPGCLTKGDLDLAIRVEQKDFEAAEFVLDSMFDRNEGSYKSPSFASFRKDTTPSLGIQLVVAQSELDVFVRFRDMLRSDQNLLEQYNALKLNCQNASMQDYRIAKSEFIQLVLNWARSAP